MPIHSTTRFVMKALYERVLAQLPTPRLHESCNAVLKEEFASVSQNLDDVVAAFAKLQEVHDAVSKLQQRHQSTGGRSNSVRASMDDAMDLQQQLQRQVEKLAAGMEVAQVQRKRKRVKEEVPGAINSVRSSGDENRTASCNGATNEAKRLKAGVDLNSDRSGGEIKRCAQKAERGDSFVVKREVTGSASSSKSESGGEDDDDESDDDADEVEGSEAAWKALTTKGNPSSNTKAAPSPAKPPAKQTETDTSTTKPSKESAVYMSTIVEVMKKLSVVGRWLIIPEVLTALKESVEEDVDGLQQSAVTSSLKVLVSWWDRNSEYQVQYAELYREYAAVVKSYADRLPSSDQNYELERLVGALSSTINSRGDLPMPGSARENVATAARSAKARGGISSVITGKGRHEPAQSVLYRMIVDALRVFSNGIPDVSTRDRVVELLESLSEAVSASSNSEDQRTGD
ncbi:hypothetical protein PR003_g14863 [Phytophthora rubi]|uniref:Uncharacterized protein n=2 Tax=Phytophthora rubi TaxID=129364 RepID=A0A6A4EY61_9STRA|nr:hypothetical protein PR003_g14863 [Phytophthora rubi]